MAIALDQDVGFSGTTTTTIIVSGTFPAGALICVAVGFATATSGQSISQSGSVFTNLFTRENSATNNLVYWVGYLKNWAGGALSTTFTLSGAGKDAGARLLSFTGVDTTAPLLLSHDAGGATKSTTMDSGAATGTTNTTDLLVGFFTWANTADISGTITLGTTPASGWTITAHSNGSSANTPHGHALFTYQILAGSAATNPDASVTFTVPSAGVSWGAQIATFKAAAGGATDLLTGTSGVTFGAVGGLSVDNKLAGAGALTFGAQGALSSDKKLAGDGALTVGAQGSLSADKKLAGASGLVFGAQGTLSSDKRVSGAAGIVFDTKGALSVDKRLAGVAGMTFESAAPLKSDKKLAGVAGVVFGSVGRLYQPPAVVNSASASVAQNGASASAVQSGAGASVAQSGAAASAVQGGASASVVQGGVSASVVQN